MSDHTIPPSERLTMTAGIDPDARQSEELNRFRELLSILDPAALTRSDLVALIDMLAEAYKAKVASKAAGVE